VIGTQQSTNELDNLKTTIARLEKLLDTSSILNSNLNLDNLLLSIVNAAVQLTHAEAASILLLDKRTGSLYFEATTSQQRDQLSHVLVPLEGSIAGWIVQHGQPLVLNDAAHDPRHFSDPDEKTDFLTKALLGVPLQVKGKTIGALEVLNPLDGRHFNDEDLKVITILATQAAVAIENARLFNQSDQIADIIHELRTPITAIMGYCALLLTRDDLERQAQRNYLETINREAEQLNRMITHFLDLARLETRRLHLEMVPTDLNQVVSEAFSLLEPQAQNQALQIACNLPKKSPIIIADPNHLKQVMINLINNAIKYNRPGGSVEVRVKKKTNRAVAVSVTDTGIGMSEETLENIFDKFYRATGHESKVEGAGLGLSIVKEIIEAHSGDIHVDSKVGHGSTFTITLPLEQRREGSRE
jgi:signal transduction histidine kinase